PVAVLTEAHRPDAAIERFGRFHTLRRARSVAGDERKGLHAVRAPLFLIALEKGDGLAVRIPLGAAAAAAARRRRQRFLGRSRLCIGDKQLTRRLGVGTGVAIAQEPATRPAGGPR